MQSLSPDLDAYLATLPSLAAGPGGAVLRRADGGIEQIPLNALTRRLLHEPVVVCNQMLVARRAGISEPRLLDALELFAFVRPAQACIPTPRGLAAALGLDAPGTGLAHDAALIARAVRALIADLVRPDYPFAAGLALDAAEMANGGWAWAEPVLLALSERPPARQPERALWDDIREWEDEAPPPPPGTLPVDPQDAARRLRDLVGADAEERPAQQAFASATAAAFAPPLHANAPIGVLAEAGTGIGKTLGYVAPASLWAEKNGGTVWLSTFTKNLQRQLDQELEKLYPDPRVRAERAVIRKGRENYLCLLNLEDRSRQGALNPRARLLIGLVKRWARFTRDGDMIGGDFPSWLAAIYGGGRIMGLTDRRGECIYSACAHYRRCFIERAARKSRHASLVVANHAVVMVQAARRRTEAEAPKRIVFDEGHHLFDAADSAFAVALSGAEAIELRRWIRGAEGVSGRARGLRARIGDLLGEDADDEDGSKLLADALRAAQALPADGLLKRLQEGDPFGPAEQFLYHVRTQVHARAAAKDEGHGLEASANDPLPGLVDAAAAFAAALDDLARPLHALSLKLLRRLDDEAETLDTATRNRIESFARSIAWRVETVATGWRAMLESLGGPPPPAFVDWFAVERFQGRELDVGMQRRWIDPTEPFAGAVLENAHGVVITSATLRDHDPEAQDADHWQSAEMRTGFPHLALPPARVSLASPFDYPGQTRVFIVTDVKRSNADQVAAAYRELFLASGGGALGLFTAINRLRGVHERIEGPLDQAGLALYAQHVNPMDTGSLVDIFKADENSCLLGTDAVRDGVDVPGRALRLIVFDRVPWPRPTILHRVRRDAFGGRRYDDMLTRLKLKQAFGRLIRRASDRGVFVILDSATPSRLLTAFPPGVTVERVGLAEAIAGTRAFVAASEATES